MHNDVLAAVAALTGLPVALSQARTLLPKAGGLYAWWVRDNALSGARVPGCKHPTAAQLDLLYVGIAPNGPASKATLRSRIVGNHIGGNIAASTLRRTLASLLVSELALTPIRRGTKVVLPADQNKRLSGWQEQHLRLTWFATSQPWATEAAVIATLHPPLNLAANSAHPFHATLSAARRSLQGNAR